MLDEDSAVYDLLESKNRYDIELYMYAVQLFEEQFIQLGFDDDAINSQLGNAPLNAPLSP